VADTSGLLALFNRTEHEHRAATTAADACGLLVISAITLTEVHQVANLDLDLADAVAAAVAAEYRTEVVLTLDRRDFRAMRKLTTHTAFRLLPDDL
jgi:predicted nucleic acid-binding protein